MIYHDPLERTSLSVALVYCSILSASFVGSLYYIIPRRIRILDRDHHQQIKWRTATTTVVCILSTYAPAHPMPSLTWRQSVHAILGVVSHTALLYLGPITQMIVQVIIQTRQTQQERHQRGTLSFLTLFFKTWYASFMEPVLHSLLFTTLPNERWVCLRNYFIAPITEEIVFRQCIVPILHSTGMSTLRIVGVAPLFFGMAHLHHAIVRWHQPTILFQTLVQFLYTSVFGAYAVYAYLRTGSIAAVVLSHTVCNGMGLPDLAFLARRPFSPLYRYRYWLGCGHVAGMVCFYWGLQSTWLLPDHQSNVSR